MDNNDIFGGPPGSPAKPNTFRTIYDPTRSGESETRSGKFHTVGALTSSFRNLTLADHPLKYKFFNTPFTEYYNYISKTIPLDELPPTMETLARPIYQGFIELSGDPEFENLCEEGFYQKLYWLEKIYVGYDFFNGPLVFEGTGQPTNDIERQIEKLKKKGGYSCFTKLTNNDYDDNIDFMHIDTGLTFKVHDWEDKLVIARWGTNCNNFKNWFIYTINWLIGRTKLNLAGSLTMARLQIIGEDYSELENDLNGRIYNCSPIIMSGERAIDLKGTAFYAGTDLDSLQRSIWWNLDRWAYELGRVSNTNPKGDRHSTGENYKDIVGIAARQKEIVNCLKSFAYRCNKLLKPNQWKFEVNGIPDYKTQVSGMDQPGEMEQEDEGEE